MTLFIYLQIKFIYYLIVRQPNCHKWLRYGVTNLTFLTGEKPWSDVVFYPKNESHFNFIF